MTGWPVLPRDLDLPDADPQYFGCGQCPRCGNADAGLYRRVYPDPRAALEPIACQKCLEAIRAAAPGPAPR